MYVQGFLHWVFLGGRQKKIVNGSKQIQITFLGVINLEFLRDQQKCDMCKVLDSLQVLRDADMEEG